ncbi:MAG: nuclear transport factor 2 family protein [Solirubrobacteraceae bacterium]
MSAQDLLDRLAIRELVENWFVHRDNRDWERFFEVWHDDGVMMTTWGGRTTPHGFAEAAQRGYDRGDRMLHACGPTNVELAGDRAIAQSKLRIMQRGLMEGVECDVTCIGRVYDFYERRGGRWGLVLRQPIYECDFIAPVDPADTVTLDPDKLARLPDGYARLGYLQAGLGYTIKPDMPTESGRELEALLAQGRSWLEGGELTWAREPDS